jgi:hypothetical protein
MSIPRPTDQELGGMTVNERLVMCGVIDKWDDAVRRRSRAEMIAVLRGVAMTEDQATQTSDAVLQNPKKYGF